MGPTQPRCAGRARAARRSGMNRLGAGRMRFSRQARRRSARPARFDPSRHCGDRLRSASPASPSPAPARGNLRTSRRRRHRTRRKSRHLGVRAPPNFDRATCLPRIVSDRIPTCHHFISAKPRSNSGDEFKNASTPTREQKESTRFVISSSLISKTPREHF